MIKHKDLYIIGFLFTLLLVSCSNDNNGDMTNLSGNINYVTFASEKEDTIDNSNKLNYIESDKNSVGLAHQEDIVYTTDVSNSYSNVQIPHTLSSYTTEFTKWSKGRNANIALAAKALNGKIIQPGEVFSFNKAVGPTVKSRGYKLAKVFKKGKEEKGYGGGVCQVSSTLYNAADNAGLEIIERYPHSKEVHYVPKDRDAATSYGGIDFKFKNNKPYPIIISTLVKDEKVTVNIDTKI